MNQKLKRLGSGFLWGVIPFGLLEMVGWSVPILRQRFYENPLLFNGYHIHHSVLGLVCVAIWLYLLFRRSEKSYFWLGLGLGIMVIHTLMDGRFIFLERGMES